MWFYTFNKWLQSYFEINQELLLWQTQEVRGEGTKNKKGILCVEKVVMYLWWRDETSQCFTYWKDIQEVTLS